MDAPFTRGALTLVHGFPVLRTALDRRIYGALKCRPIVCRRAFLGLFTTAAIYARLRRSVFFITNHRRAPWSNLQDQTL